MAKAISINIKNHTLSPRQKDILSHIVENYAQTAKPVGSEWLRKKSGFDVSPATIRNEMADLEKKGYISHSYTSSGRVPTDKGFRFYVDNLMRKDPLSSVDQKSLSDYFGTFQHHHEMLKEVSKVLADLTSQVGLTVLPNHEIYHYGIANILSNPEFEKSEEAFEIINLVDKFDEYLDLVSLQVDQKNENHETTIYIGNELPFGKVKNYSFVLTTYNLADWGEGFLGVFGPKRMEYPKIVPILDHFSDILSGSTLEREGREEATGEPEYGGHEYGGQFNG